MDDDDEPSPQTVECLVALFAPGRDNQPPSGSRRHGLLLPEEDVRWFLDRRWLTHPFHRPSTLRIALREFKQAFRAWYTTYQWETWDTGPATVDGVRQPRLVIWRGDQNVQNIQEFRDMPPPFFFGDNRSACFVYERNGACLRGELRPGERYWFLPSRVRYTTLFHDAVMGLVRIVGDLIRTLRRGMRRAGRGVSKLQLPADSSGPRQYRCFLRWSVAMRNRTQSRLSWANDILASTLHMLRLVFRHVAPRRGALGRRQRERERARWLARAHALFCDVRVRSVAVTSTPRRSWCSRGRADARTGTPGRTASARVVSST